MKRNTVATVGRLGSHGEAFAVLSDLFFIVVAGSGVLYNSSRTLSGSRGM